MKRHTYLFPFILIISCAANVKDIKEYCKSTDIRSIQCVDNNKIIYEITDSKYINDIYCLLNNYKSKNYGKILPDYLLYIIYNNNDTLLFYGNNNLLSHNQYFYSYDKYILKTIDSINSITKQHESN
jgi:hypothetical protein